MILRWIAAHRSTVATAVSGAVVAAIVATAAIVSTGFETQRMDLDDGAVWVANGEQQAVGRANTEVLELDTAVVTAGTELEVVQRGTTVLSVDRANATLDLLDPATAAVVETVPLPPDAPQVFLAGSRAVVFSGGTGEVWFVPLDALASFDPESSPALTLGADSLASVDEDGTLVVFSPGDSNVYRVDAAVSDAVASSTRVEIGGEDGAFAVTSVSGRAVVLDVVARTLSLDGVIVDLSDELPAGSRPTLQRASATGDRVLVAHTGGLLSVGFSGDVERSVGDLDGLPAAPVVVGECVFAAWASGDGWRSCAGEERSLDLDAVSSSAQLTFDVNGDRVLLSDPRRGAAWAVQDAGELIDNWDELIEQPQNPEEAEENDDETPPELEKTQVPPVAIADEFGARPGRASVLPVLLNDYDPNGDVLVISEFTTLPQEIGRLDLISDRQQLQLTLTPGASGEVGFDYTITDGRGASSTARVTVQVRGDDENEAPRQMRSTRVSVETGGRVEQNVLGDWMDPDGDPFYLESASAAAPDRVSHRPGGVLVFSDAGAGGETKSVGLVVSDGSSAGTGTLEVRVESPGEVPLVADPFAVLAYAGQERTIEPLVHARGGSGELRLNSVPEKTGVTIVPSYEAGTFRFESEQARTHYLEYVVTDGDQTATGLIRVDVVAPPDPNSTPITVPKTVFIPSLSDETIDIAASDIDPAGGVLLVTGVDGVPTELGLEVDVLEQRAVRISLTAPLDAPVSFAYRVSNGLAEADGIVTVIEIPRPARLQPPVATDDTATVRVGDAIDIPVLANDEHPDGEELSLEPQLARDLPDGSGLLFASENELRYLAPSRPGNFSAVYQVKGPDGQVAQAEVRIAVREADEATNNPPVPDTIVARVLAGETVRVPIPLAGIDPDGDSVQFLGQETNPAKGTVVESGADWVEYEAGEYSAGTDEFRVALVDSLGATASGLVRIGISPRPEGARNPVAIEDSAVVRPGRSVGVQVLANDSDPDGRALTVAAVEPTDDRTTAEVSSDGSVVSITPPREEGVYGVLYTVENDVGGTATAFVTVTVDPEAPLSRPIANDTVLSLSDVLDRESIDVDVLANVFFADAAAGAPDVSVLPGFGSSVEVLENQSLRIRLRDERQIIPFSVAHPDDASVVAYAFVWVPGFDDALPQRDRRAPDLVVDSEEPLTIDINEQVVAVGGAPVRLTDSASVRATHSDGSDLVVDDQTLRFTSADSYFGTASISFEVTDGESADDPDGRVAVIVLPITVLPRENQPPVFNGGLIEFEPAQEKVLDLVKLTTYPYPDDVDQLTFTVQRPLPQGFTYSLDGQRLTLRADEDAATDSVTAITVGVRDGAQEGTAGRVQLTVVPSTRPLARPVPDTATVQRGATTVLDVLRNDAATNPFPGGALSVVGIRGLDGGGLPAGVRVTPSEDRSRLTVSVSEDAAPVDVNLQYQVADATRDPDRYVWGSIRISVQDVPDAPTAPVRQDAVFEGGKLTLRLSAPAANNSPITGYRIVSESNGGYSHDCGLSLVCELTDLQAGVPYRFSAVASNALGDSAPSPVSVPLSSDFLPDAPASVSAVPSGESRETASLRISWPAVPNPSPGSAVTGYVVTVTGPGVSFRTEAAGPLTTTAGGQLVFNQSYEVAVYARNSAQVLGEGDWLETITSARTVGPPSAPGSPQAAINSDNTNGEVRITWGGSDPNGAGGVSYTVGRVEGQSGAIDCTPQSKPNAISGSVSSGWIDTTAVDRKTYTYVIYADNGLFCTAAATGPIEAKKPPGQASGTVSVQERPGSGQYDIRVNQDLSVASGGGHAHKYQARVNGGGWFDVDEGDWLTSIADSSVYGTTVNVAFRACRDASEQYCGQESQPSSGVPVNVRASILDCQVGSPATAKRPIMVGGEFSYVFQYDDGGLLSDWEEAEVAPEPAGLFGGGVTQARVAASVTIGGTVYPDNGWSEPFNCTN